MARADGEIGLIRPDWPAPDRVRAVSTTRRGGFSVAPYASLNLGHRVGDDPVAVQRNRALLLETLGVAESPRWLDQVHGTRLVDAERVSAAVQADGAVTSHPGVICGVLTADCLPVLLCDRDGTAVAALHGGWRGLAGGIASAGVGALATRGIPPGSLLAWLGPAIGPTAYQVGPEVRAAFAGTDGLAAFCPQDDSHWLLDLYALARAQLRAAGVEQIFGGGYCTFDEEERFFSYRRDGTCGRQATLIWLNSDPLAPSLNQRP